MPNWNEIHNEIEATGSTHDVVRRRYLSALHELTGRNAIVYYSGWLQKPNLPGVEINDADKNGFMSAIYQLDRNKGLDLVLHTPGGDTAATESLVDYLHSMFSTDIRAIVPQLAMSAGTMVACACREIIMGKHSSLGPDRSSDQRHTSAWYSRRVLSSQERDTEGSCHRSIVATDYCQVSTYVDRRMREGHRMVQRDDGGLALKRHVQRHKGSALSSVPDSHRACRSLGYENTCSSPICRALQQHRIESGRVRR